MTDETNETKPFLINVEEVPWEQFAPPRGRFGMEDRYLSGYVRTRKLDISMTRLAPGQVSAPYHFHHAEEELFYVLEGEGKLRYGGEERRLRPGDVVACPPGPEGAHQFINDTDAPLVYLAISDNQPWEICEYPDSNKVLVGARRPDGRSAFRGVFPAEAKVDYWYREALADEME